MLCREPTKGKRPDNKINNKTPALHISAFVPYSTSLTTSGAINCGIPTRPKKHISIIFNKFINFSFTNAWKKIIDKNRQISAPKKLFSV